MHRIDDVDEINEVLFQRNRIHFAQADGTPCTTQAVKDIIGTSGTTTSAQQILKGQIPTTLPTSLQQLLAELNHDVPQLSPFYPFQQMLDGFSKWRENTTTSPSQKHLGIYKAITLAHKLNIYTEKEKALRATPPDNPAITTTPKDPIATILAKIQHKIINIAIKHQHTLNRWRTVHNFFLEKIPGKPLITKLRVIHIYEADYNIILKYFISKKTLQHAIHHKTIAKEQAGGRPGRTACDEAIQTIATYETCQLQQISAGGIMYNDAKACFDRIIENISNLTCLNAGAPIQVLNLHHQTVESMQYLIKHKYGISPLANGHNKPDPFYGVGQGAGDSGARWGFISDMIIQAYNTKSHSAELYGPISKIFSDQRVQAFVDDSRLFIILPSDDTNNIQEHLKQDVQTWENFLQTTGAKLELSKCKFFIFTWTFDKNGNPVINTVDQPSIMEIIDSDSKQPIEVSELKSNDDYKLLGVPISFDGNTKGQEKMLQEKAEHIIKIFTQAPLPPYDLVSAFNTIAIPTLNYPLAATSISSANLHKIQQRLTYSLLPKLGLNRTFPRAIVYASPYFGGIRFQNLDTTQSVHHIMSLIGHLRINTTLKTTYQQLIESHMIATGITLSTLEYVEPTDYVDAPWIDVARTFLRKINAKITSSIIPNIPPLREQDIPIMQYAISTENYLQVLYLSEICDTTGRAILDIAYKPNSKTTNELSTFSTSQIQWHQQNFTPTRSWTTWQELLNEFTSNSTTRNLTTPLGKWTSEVSQYRQWNFHYHHHATNPYVTTTDLQIWALDSTSRNNQKFILQSEATTTQQHNENYIPVVPTCTRPHLIIALPRRTSLYEYQPQPVIQPTTWYRKLANQSKSLHYKSFTDTVHASVVNICTPVRTIANKSNVDGPSAIKSTHYTKAKQS